MQGIGVLPLPPSFQHIFKLIIIRSIKKVNKGRLFDH